MNCTNCYQEVPDGAKFCPHCGAKQPVPGATHMQAPSREAASQTQQTVNTEAGMAEEKITEGLQAEETVTNTTTEQPIEAEEETKIAETANVPGMESEEVTGETAQDIVDTVAAEVVPQEQPADQTANEYQYGQQSNTQDLYSQPNDSQNDYNQQGDGQNNYGQNNYDQNGYNQNGYNNYNQANYGQPNYGQNYNQPNYNQQKPLNWVPYLVLSIISTVCCCLPFGIVAIVFSAKINSAMAAGNIEEAQHAAKNAKIWIIVAFAVGIIVNIITFMLGMTGFVGEYYYY